MTDEPKEKHWLAEEIRSVFAPAFRNGFSCGGMDAKSGSPPPARKRGMFRMLSRRLFTRYAGAVWREGYAVGYDYEKKLGLRNNPEKHGEVE